MIFLSIVSTSLQCWEACSHGGRTVSAGNGSVATPHPTGRSPIERASDGYTVGMPAAPSVRLIEERRFDPPRAVEVEHNGRWWPGFQYAWRLCAWGCRGSAAR